MKTTTLIFGTLALSAALFAVQTPMNSKGQSCCAGLDAMQHGEEKTAKSVRAKSARGIQKAVITVQNGAYHPAAIHVKVGKPVQLTFKGGNRIGCAGAIEFKSLNIRRTVTAGKSVVVKFTPKKAGEILFACSMNMAKGKVIVK